jgi:hypothetical protein
MNTRENNPFMENRREVLRTGLRCGGVLALGGIATLLGWRSVRGDCVKSSPCGACPLFSGCNLPKDHEVKHPRSKLPNDHG